MSGFVTEVDRAGLLAAVSPACDFTELEHELRTLGLSCGFVRHPNDTPMILAEALCGVRCAEPFLQLTYLRDLVASLSVTLSDGRRAETWLAPRSAAGPDLKAFVMGNPEHRERLTSATLKVQPFPVSRRWRGARVSDATAAAALAKANVQGLRPASCLRLTRQDGLYTVRVSFAGTPIVTELADMIWRHALDTLPAGLVEPKLDLPTEREETLPLFSGAGDPNEERLIFAALWKDVPALLTELPAVIGEQKFCLCGAFPESALFALRVSQTDATAPLVTWIENGLLTQRLSLLEIPAKGPLGLVLRDRNADALADRFREVRLP